MEREYSKWWSPNLRRDMELLIFGHSGAKVLVFPTRGGRFYEYENIRMTEALRPKIEAGQLQLFCVDSIDSESFYCRWAHPTGRLKRHHQYEEYILTEVLPFMQEKNPHECVISHGCSLGAFHAANLAFRHPHLFKKLVCFSGRYNLGTKTEEFKDLFDGHYDDDVYFNTPTHFLPNLEEGPQLNALRAMHIILVIGREDPFLQSNIELSRILTAKGVKHELHYWEDRAHKGHYWRQMAPLYV